MQFNTSEKLSATMMTVLLAVAFPWYFNGVLFLTLLAVRKFFKPFHPSSPATARRFWAVQTYLLLIVLLMTIMNGILIKGGDRWELQGLATIHFSGVEYGLNTGIRLMVIAASLLLLFGSTPMRSIAAFLQEVGWPTQIVVTLLLTLHFIEELPERISMIFTSQEARGAPVKSHVFSRVRGFFLILSPLVLSSLVESIDRGMALELRGFRSSTKISFSTESSEYPRRSALTWVFLLLSLICLGWIILQWLRQ